MAFYSRALYIRALVLRPVPAGFSGPLQQPGYLKFSSEAPLAATSNPTPTSTSGSTPEQPGKLKESVHDFTPIPGWEELRSTSTLPEDTISKAKIKLARGLDKQPEGKKTSKNKLRRSNRYLKEKREDQSYEANLELPPVSSLGNDIALGQEQKPAITDEWSFLSGGDTEPFRPTTSEPRDQRTNPDKSPKESWRARKEQIIKAKKSSGNPTWTPNNRITFEEQTRLKTLRSEDPVKWHIRALSKEFKISPDAVIRIIKSRYRSSDLRFMKTSKTPTTEDPVDVEEWAKLGEEEKEILQMIEQSDSIKKDEEELLDENDPFGDLETVDSDAVETEPKTIQRRWEKQYEEFADARQRDKAMEEERAKIRSDLWGWQPLKANRKRNSRKIQAEKPVEVKSEATVVENPVEENPESPSDKSTFNWVLALQNKKKTP